jgi:hypothetical protein
MGNPVGGVGAGNFYFAPDHLKKNAAEGDFDQHLDPTQHGKGDMGYYLQIMQQMQQEARAFTTYSNILTTRHNAAMAAVRNIRA